ncbi:hypothetical protein F2Q69_00013661 [Brassica cretica]|uniref:Uncharacterized protein n=1 Tax=Brassica cretica TaxID=69181 RepID=A0A8S9R3Y5_BRACR|nr:hypothetical protein F2Q69_00013661 [Brassica cretica]
MNLELGRNASWTRAGLDANGLRLETRAADHRTGAVAVGIASGSDANGALERLGAGADQVDTSWNGVMNRLGFVGIVGFGLGFQSKSARTVSVREGASLVRSTSGFH